MLKQLKKLKSNKKISKKKFKKSYLRIKKLLNTTFSYHSKKSNILNNVLNWNKLKATIRVTANNIFCTLIKNNKIIYVGSSGIYKCKSSQRKMKFVLKNVIKIFYTKINTLLDNETNLIFVEITTPLKVRRILIKSLSLFKKKKKNLVINIKPKKCFNGCVPPKKVRKRKKKMRIFK
jgi:hypothetical protein